MQLPAPPLLKTTIIQLNKDIDPVDNNYEILTNEYSNNGTAMTSLSLSLAISEDQPRKKRRRSSLFVDDEELARRRNETKQLHSIIEKRRRVKINREFEALKYLIPACPTTDASTKRASSNSNSSKIDGMYKLTILKSAVEYILYLHHIIQRQHSLLAHHDEYRYDIAYTTVPLDVNQYRNIDKEFDFGELGRRAEARMEAKPEQRTAQRPETRSDKRSDKRSEKRSEKRSDKRTTSEHRPEQAQPKRSDSMAVSRSRCETISEEPREPARQNTSAPRAKSESYMFSQLPTPDVTPDIAPILSLLTKYSESQQSAAKATTRPGNVQVSTRTGAPDVAGRSSNMSNSTSSTSSSLRPSNTTGPAGRDETDLCDLDALNKAFLFDQAIHRSGSLSLNTSPFTIPIKSHVKRNAFYLPDPALSLNSSGASSNADLPTIGEQTLPSRTYLKPRIPLANYLASTTDEVDMDDLTEGERLEDASKTLLALRKPSIDQLLN